MTRSAYPFIPASDFDAATGAAERQLSERCAGLTRKLQHLFGENLVRYETLSFDHVGRPVEVVADFSRPSPSGLQEGGEADFGGGLGSRGGQFGAERPARVYTQLHLHKGDVAIRVILIGEPAQYRHLGAAEAWVAPAEAALIGGQHWLSPSPLHSAGSGESAPASSNAPAEAAE